MNERAELVVFVVLAIVGAGVVGTIGVGATSDIPVSHGKADARETATGFLRSLGYDISAYSTNTVFESDERTGTYLQRKLPLERARNAAQTYSIHVWEVRFYRPLNQTEFYVDVDPSTGRVVGFERNVPDGAPGKRLSAAAARGKARLFLTVRGYDLSAFEPVRNASTDHRNRRDHVFAWQHRHKGVADAPLRVTVEVQGGRVGSYSEELNVPDQFAHQFEIQQNRNDLFGSVSSLFLVLIALVALGFGVRYYRQGRFAVRPALAVGGLVTTVVLAQQLNGIPGSLHGMPTTTTPARYLLQTAIVGLINAVLLGVIAGMLFGAGSQLARDVLGKSLIGSANPGATASILKFSTLRGFCSGWIMLGYVTLFYWLGVRYFDFWQPVGTPYTEAMSTFLPVIAVIGVGLLPAVLEELVFRVVGISLGARYLRFSAVAIVATAVIWAFGHSQYVVLPPYARFIELTIVGIIAGWLFLRYDFVTVLGYHFTYNASITALPMLLADLPFVVANGGVGMLVASLPLLISIGTVGYDRLSSNGLETILASERGTADSVIDLLATTDEHVLTTAEVAGQLNLSQEAARDELEALHEADEIERKQIGDDAVWWM